MENILNNLGKMIYGEKDNPYEINHIYFAAEPEFTIKRYEADCEPDGGYSWSIIVIDEQNVKKLQALVQGDMETFLKDFFGKNRGLNAFRKFLEENEIKYNFQYHVGE